MPSRSFSPPERTAARAMLTRNFEGILHGEEFSAQRSKQARELAKSPREPALHSTRAQIRSRVHTHIAHKRRTAVIPDTAAFDLRRNTPCSALDFCTPERLQVAVYISLLFMTTELNTHIPLGWSFLYTYLKYYTSSVVVKLAHLHLPAFGAPPLPGRRDTVNTAVEPRDQHCYHGGLCSSMYGTTAAVLLLVHTRSITTIRLCKILECCTSYLVQTAVSFVHHTLRILLLACCCTYTSTAVIQDYMIFRM